VIGVPFFGQPGRLLCRHYRERKIIQMFQIVDFESEG
jgi:hypothetical protein